MQFYGDNEILMYRLECIFISSTFFFSFSPFSPLILIDGSFLWSKKWHVVMFFCRVSCGSIYIYICMAFFLGRCSGCVLSVF